jgi:hypothetical protein
MPDRSNLARTLAYANVRTGNSKLSGKGGGTPALKAARTALSFARVRGGPISLLAGLRGRPT